ncbi:flavodoxin domain-containing protein [Corynebacterium gerontici]|uniref:Flavodoxin domain protein n=1 Tax=Corynebacterium gerontici TaxID=2079234 RepID=A0A3G6IZM8_9CORY|nr:flavodoxin domain-containing protein [Corynebacterium gerontici]AZA11106.1 Flavodoxin domain protein [Corynebacterium gerontici]
MVHIRYQSIYGSTRTYALALAQQLGVEALDFSHPVAEGEPVIVMSYVHGPVIPALHYIREHNLQDHPLAVVAVGMTPLADAQRKDQLASHLGADVARFYLPGRLFYSELQPKHRAVMRSLVALLRPKPRKSDAEMAILEGYGKDIDCRDMAALEPIVAWAQEC